MLNADFEMGRRKRSSSEFFGNHHRRGDKQNVTSAIWICYRIQSGCKKTWTCAANNTEKDKAGPSSMKQTTLSVPSFSTSKSMQDQIELQVTRYIVASNRTLLQVENKQFEQLFTMLRPGTKILNRSQGASIRSFFGVILGSNHLYGGRLGEGLDSLTSFEIAESLVGGIASRAGLEL